MLTEWSLMDAGSVWISPSPNEPTLPLQEFTWDVPHSECVFISGLCFYCRDHFHELLCVVSSNVSLKTSTPVFYFSGGGGGGGGGGSGSGEGRASSGSSSRRSSRDYDRGYERGYDRGYERDYDRYESRDYKSYSR